VADFESLALVKLDNIIIKDILEKISQGFARGKIATGKVLTDPKVFAA
jgi:hypothetical protein